MSLTPEEIDRYKRHLVLKEVGGAGQQKLKQSKVLVVGAGGLGSPVLLYLAAAGVGTLGIIDDDRVSLDNLQRQIVHDSAHVGDLKTESAAKMLEALNPHVEVCKYSERLTADNALDIISQYDVVADGSDNFATRYLVNDACYFAKKPLVFAAVGPLDGHITTFRSFEQDDEGRPKPNYRCIFPEPPPPGTVANCSEVGILGAIAGVVGTLQAMEVIKELLQLGESLSGRLLIYDARACRFQTVNIAWDPENPLNGEEPIFHDLSHHKSLETIACQPTRT
jgi:molybdopterin/thiamine biosynthesis adenylyltransferase